MTKTPMMQFFANGSLHEWANPGSVFDEIWQVLKPGGKYFFCDMRGSNRDEAAVLRCGENLPGYSENFPNPFAPLSSQEGLG
jgi:SAM-dependent methyltransferase